MAKKKSTNRKTPSKTPGAKYSFAQALAFAEEHKLQTWKRVLSKKADSGAPEAGEQFAELKKFHKEVRSEGSVREIIATDAGYAKRFCAASQVLALKNNFVVSTVSGLVRAPLNPSQLAVPLQQLELDVPKSYPGRLYHAIVSNLVFPNGERGPMHLIKRAGELRIPRKKKLKDSEWSEMYPSELESLIGCDPLVWLLSRYKRRLKVGAPSEKLAIVLSGTQMDKKEIRKFFAPQQTENDIKWPAMNQRDQADLTCYLLSGISKLVRALGFSGLVLLLELDRIFSDGRDEISVKEPDRTKRRRALTAFERDMTACFGGLIWSAIAPGDKRMCFQTNDGRISRKKCRHSKLLKHTGNQKSKTAYPFTTQARCQLGVLYSAISEKEVAGQVSREFGQLGSIALPV